MLQSDTCYARIYPQINTCHFYKDALFEVLYKGNHARKHTRSPIPRGGRPRWTVPRTQRRRMKRWCFRWKIKERTGCRKSSLTLRRSFPSPSPSCAGVAVSNFASMTRTDVQDQCRIIRRCCCCSLTTAKRCRSCWWPSRVVVILLPSTASKSADCVPPYGRTYFKKKHVPPYGGE